MVYEFAIAGEPVPQGSMKHVGGGRLVHSKKLLVWRKKVAHAIRSKTNAKLDGPVVVDVLFVIGRPKTVKRDVPSVAPDLDKLQRAIGDALSIDCDFLADDALIVEWHSRKIYGDPGVILRIITS